MNFISGNADAPTKIIYEYISAFGGISMAFAIIMLGIKMLLGANKKDTRERAMESLGKIAAGGFILGISLILAGFLGWMANTSGIDLNTKNSTYKTDSNKIDKEDQGTFIQRGVAEVIDAVPKAVENVIDANIGFKPLGELIFSTSKKGLAPFENQEWENLNYLYTLMCTLVAPLFLIMIAKTGFSMILFSDSVSKKIDLKEELMNWFLCVFLLAAAPLFIQGLFELFNAFTDALNAATKSILGDYSSSPAFKYSLLDSLKTGSPVTTAIVHLLYAWQNIRINIIFLSRKVVLTVMYVFTPIAIALWGINHKVHAAAIWFGEMITNAAMQFFYAFTFTVMIAALGASTWQNWLLALIWITALTKVAEMLRNSLQGFFTKVSGLDETTLGGGALGTVGAIAGGMASAFGMTLGGNRSNGEVAGSPKDFKASNVANKIFGNTLGSTNKGGNSVKSSGPVSSNATSFGDNLKDYGSYNMGDGFPVGNNDKEYNIDKSDTTVEKFKQDSAKQGLNNSILADNLNAEMSNNKAGSRTKGLLTAMTAGDPMFKGVVQAGGNLVSGVQNRISTAKAIYKTASQMEKLGLSKNRKEAVEILFGGNNDLKARFKNLKVLNKPANVVLNHTANTKVGKTLRTAHNVSSFSKNISKGNNNAAAMNLTKAHPFNKLGDKDKRKIIAQTNPYTSIDGFNEWS
ncbi:hypothetical protein BJV85_001831 [Clostridium acetobutylicum]|uniref:Predicted membrane protein n=1 Tax=Clostridium acetobutylicum (strain ATCC 824 / DSM 792 / JCM 1419 / IAM 19013 / LMG 5710 / NBRC 13948 / NRRL B-527 / VKM B-1787 / 2291 / W) TaxID=272562 RepID=Q97HG5_CLOAB|nr:MULTISPECIES: hypothetical protein [Clostridium]AAK80005.1 Predicted membrane protein [Clostridium acetobutylicum ATCC 824]ADZ21097.1 membrane protein [Clostridium acetobutylicum EA 2018]AEI32152.1 hypothetical protein SMB_G2078 [Clostridium acetobutylicum DSM 1731]AWV79565.1 hypothetical protein DK921_05515 [Clostridium acetobutylicum]MBC2394460.1 hypothetical protein [Clostridium acetobutylicum]